ncbi:MAG TPA: phosphoglycerate mutase family protein [Actinomycetes bacterium]|nr:phosphoglycerate mutase family protein [Actinomycetes bacterium]
MAGETAAVFLVRHAKAADRESWTGADRDRPLIERGRAQAERLAAALAPERPAVVAASPWLRCVETAEPLAKALGLEVEPDDRLGYDGFDLAGFVQARVTSHPGRSVVAVGHGDLIPLYLAEAGLVDGHPRFRTGSLFRLDLHDGRPQRATLVDRRDLRR